MVKVPFVVGVWLLASPPFLGAIMATNWLSTKDAVKALDLPRHRLLRLRQDGLFQLGKHYRVISYRNAKRPTYQWHINNCLKALNTPLEKR